MTAGAKTAHNDGRPAPASVRERIATVGLVDGATFFLDAPTVVPAIWGQRTDVLWPEGEPTMLDGPDGVGKTTIAQQITLRRIGIGEQASSASPSNPSRPTRRCSTSRLTARHRHPGRVGRMVSDQHRRILRERLVVWRGSVPFDVVRDPGSLADFAVERNAGGIIVDSVKDLAENLSDEEVGMAIHRAWQLCVEALPGRARATPSAQSAADQQAAQSARGRVRVAVDHRRLRERDPRLGRRGRPDRQPLHLKQPADIVGPFTLLHNNRAGTVVVADSQPDPVDLVAGWVGYGADGAGSRRKGARQARRRRDGQREGEGSPTAERCRRRRQIALARGRGGRPRNARLPPRRGDRTVNRTDRTRDRTPGSHGAPYVVGARATPGTLHLPHRTQTPPPSSTWTASVVVVVGLHRRAERPRQKEEEVINQQEETDE